MGPKTHASADTMDEIRGRSQHNHLNEIEFVNTTGLKRFIVLFFIELSTRRVEIGGIARNANGLWMAQIARNITDDVEGFFKGKRYLIHDRDRYTHTSF
jgi:hypothetical protein